MTMSTLFIISAPSGAGKTSLVRALLEALDDVSVSISHTTRVKRPQERNGVDYYFITRPQFQAMVKSGEFLEYAEVFDNYYGTSWLTVENQLAAGKDVILEIDWQGARMARNRMPQCRSIFILPPSRSALEGRLHKRAQDSKAIIQRRMRDAENEMQHYSEFDYVVVNDQFNQALTDLKSIVITHRLTLAAQQHRYQKLLASLLDPYSG